MNAVSPYARKVWIAVGIAALVGIVLLVAKAAISILFLVFAGTMVAVYFRGLADLLEAHTPLGRRLSITAILLVHLALTAALVVFAVPSIEDQVQRFVDRVPDALERLRSELRTHGWGRWLLANLPSPGEVVQGGGWVSRITGVLSTTLNVVVYLFIIAFVGVYGALEPQVYRRGLLLLVPKGNRERASEVVSRAVHTLRWWLVGRFSSAAIIGVLSTVGLWIIGVPLPFLMGLIAALLTFVPNIGPTVSVVPPALLAVLHSPQRALVVIVYYALVQFLESYVITPLIQRRAIHVPPALLLTAQALLGVLVGILGIAMAAPLLVVILVLVRSFHIETVAETEPAQNERTEPA